MEQASTHGRATAVLIGAVLASAACALILPSPARMPAPSTKGEAPRIEPATAYVEAGDRITIRATTGERLWVERDGAFSLSSDVVSIVAQPDMRAANRALAIPTAMQWRHPLPGLPAALVVRAAQCEQDGIPGPLAMRTFLFTRHSPLPVLSISAKDEDLYGADKGIMVPGHWMMHPDDGVLDTYLMDIRWWKYPGNYHGRGKDWQRPARIEFIDADGMEILQTDVGLRINGQMTRGFPQHALRLVFDEPLAVAPFADGDGVGSRALVLRAAGNDQVKAMLRDAYQHRLCEGLPFETSKARTCVVYINGVYEGVHHLRQRMDEEELARRHAIKAKQITLIEDANELCHGDSADLKRFGQLMARTEKWSGRDASWLDTLKARMDVDGFLTYMASQMILGNMDWPKQNVKYWRYTGRPVSEDASLDGRWHFIMGDSDLSFGANAPASADMFMKVRSAGVPVSRLFMAMMRSPLLKEHFIANARQLIDGPLSAGRCLSELDRFAAAMDAEMVRHTARWRKPLNKRAWSEEVELMRRFAREREGHVRRQLDEFEAL